MSVIVPSVKLSEAATNDTLLAEQLRDDPVFRALWERTTLARAIAAAIVRYRAEHGLTQRDVATRLNMTQPQVARLERGDVNPNMDTLMRVTGGLGIEFVINIRPSGTEAQLITPPALTRHAVGHVSTASVDVLIAVTEASPPGGSREGPERPGLQSRRHL